MTQSLAEAARDGACWEHPAGEWRLWSIGAPDDPVATIQTPFVPRSEREAWGTLRGVGWRATSDWSSRSTIMFLLRRPELQMLTYRQRTIWAGSAVTLEASYGRAYRVSAVLGSRV